VQALVGFVVIVLCGSLLVFALFLARREFIVVLLD